MQILQCPYCKTDVSITEDVNPIRQMARCRNCKVQFQLDQTEKKKFKKRGLVDTSKVRITKDNGHLAIEFSWKPSIFMMIFALFWNLGMLIMIPALFSEGLGPQYIFLILHPAVGLVIAYYAVCSKINKTTITVDSDYVSVQCSPLPWPNVKKKILRSTIQQLYVQVYIAYRKNNIPVHKYKIIAKTKGTSFVLADGIDEYKRAISLEVTLEDELGITDTIVANEYKEE
jgi:hypothetical protein